MKIIILDNHKLIIAEIRRQVLSVLPGAECICFTKQREAIEYVKNNHVDVALSASSETGLTIKSLTGTENACKAYSG